MFIGYGSIPVNTIFSGMNIHLPAILMFTRGTRFWHTAILNHYGSFSWAQKIMLIPILGHFPRSPLSELPGTCPLQELLRKLKSVASVVAIDAPHRLPLWPVLAGLVPRLKSGTLWSGWPNGCDTLIMSLVGGISWGYHGSRWWILL